MVRKRILRRALDLKFKGARPMGHTRTKWLDRYGQHQEEMRELARN
jgi:hypothetical protein